jgi:acyl carrier protein
MTDDDDDDVDDLAVLWTMIADRLDWDEPQRDRDRFADLELDSLAMFEIVVIVEDYYAVVLPHEAIAEVDSISALAALARARSAERAEPRSAPRSGRG